jgi:membrane protease YdiL (CAAX protease family)
MEQETATPLPPGPPPGPPLAGDSFGGLIQRVFFNSEGFRAGWRFLLYAILMVLFFLGFKVALAQVWKSTPGTFSIAGLFLAEVVGFAAAFAAATVMSFIEHRPVGIYGLPVRGAFGKLFWQGALVGFIEISLLVALIWAFGGYSFGSLELRGIELLRWGALWALCFVFVGLFEEFLFRGYTLFTLSSGVGFWPASVILSLLFGAVHYQNKGEGLAGVAGVFVVGMLWCFSVRRTGTLWFAVGMHAAYDFGETFLYSVPDSGMLFPGHLSSASLHGPVWLTGGSVGPEASVFDFLIFFALFFVIHGLYPENKSPDQNVAVGQRTSSDTNTSFTP